MAARNIQESRTLQETRTTLSPAEVVRAAKQFFMSRNNIYATFLEKEGPTFASFRGQGGEELVIGASPDSTGTRVTGSTYMFDQQIARFFATLPPAPAPSTAAGAAA